jgi:photosystem II stability/assembly factor-like uncharacterized protein
VFVSSTQQERRRAEIARRKWRIAAQVAVVLFAVVGYIVSSEGNTTQFHMLPALQTEAASNSLLLDATTDGQRILIAGEQGHILYSDDNGISWTHAQVPVSLATTAVTFAGAHNAWAATHDGVLLRSTNYGEIWQTKLTGVDIARLSADAAEARVNRLQAEIDLAEPDALEDLEWALDDALFAFEDASAAIDDGVTMPLLDVWFENERKGFALGAYGILLLTSDSGSTWSLISERLDNLDNYHLYGITRSVSGTLLVAGEAGTLVRSRDHGETWDRLDSPYQGSFFGAVAAQDGGLLAFGLRGNVFRSTDEGDTWSAVVTNDQRTLLGGMTRTDGTIVLVGSAGAVLTSSDHGATFKAVSTSGNRVYSGVTETTDGRLMLVGFGGVSGIDEGDTHE